MRVNLGSGWRRIEGYVNVDLHYAADVNADLRTVEFPPGTCDEVLAVHCVEHLERADAVDLFRRVFAWLKPGGLFVVEMPERSRCLALDGLPGLKGLMGGRSVDKDGWHRWIVEHADAIKGGTAVIPEKWRLPGEAHLHVWEDRELLVTLMGIGFAAVLKSPQHHGARKNRDCRWEGTKP